MTLAIRLLFVRRQYFHIDLEIPEGLNTLADLERFELAGKVLLNPRFTKEELRRTEQAPVDCEGERGLWAVERVAVLPDGSTKTLECIAENEDI
jgi:hypothetical protein